MFNNFNINHSPSTIWNKYLFLENEKTARQFLTHKYMELSLHQPEHLAFKNVQTFIYYIKQARSIFCMCYQNNLWVQPLLLYYGMMALLKAVTLTKDVNYPSNIAVLRHGLATRKRKKMHFHFFLDDIRIQREGLFPLVLQLLYPTYTTNHLYNPKELFGFIPELQPNYETLFNETTLIPITLTETTTLDGMPFYISEIILDQLHLTPSSFVDKLNREINYPLFALHSICKVRNELCILWKHPKISHIRSWKQGFDHPWFYEDIKSDVYLFSNKHHLKQPMPELLTHYMLIFALGMLCRYETVLWGDMIYTFHSEDMILIEPFLSLVFQKYPKLIFTFF